MKSSVMVKRHCLLISLWKKSTLNFASPTDKAFSMVSLSNISISTGPYFIKAVPGYCGSVLLVNNDFYCDLCMDDASDIGRLADESVASKLVDFSD